jgi:hypothetical protein
MNVQQRRMRRKNQLQGPGAAAALLSVIGGSGSDLDPSGSCAAVSRGCSWWRMTFCRRAGSGLIFTTMDFSVCDH